MHSICCLRADSANGFGAPDSRNRFRVDGCLSLRVGRVSQDSLGSDGEGLADELADDGVCPGFVPGSGAHRFVAESAGEVGESLHVAGGCGHDTPPQRQVAQWRRPALDLGGRTTEHSHSLLVSPGKP